MGCAGGQTGHTDQRCGGEFDQFFHFESLSCVCVADVIVGSAYYLPASAMFLATVVALAVRPDMPIREAAANLIKFFMVISLSFVPAAEFGGLRFALVSASDAGSVESRKPLRRGREGLFVGFWEAFKIFRLFSNYFFAAVSILRTTIAAEAVTPAIPIKEAVAKVNKFFISDNPFSYSSNVI